jgi:hypothetical protein
VIALSSSAASNMWVSRPGIGLADYRMPI